MLFPESLVLPVDEGAGVISHTKKKVSEARIVFDDVFGELAKTLFEGSFDFRIIGAGLGR